MHDDRVATDDASDVKHLRSGQPGQEQVGGGREAESLRLGEDVSGGHVEVGGVAAWGEVRDHLVADGDPSFSRRCFFTQGDDHACSLVADRLYVMLTVPRGEPGEVGRVDSGGAHLQLHLAGAGGCELDALKGELDGRALRGDDDANGFLDYGHAAVVLLDLRDCCSVTTGPISGCRGVPVSHG